MYEGIRYGSDTLRPIAVITMKRGIQDWRVREVKEHYSDGVPFFKFSGKKRRAGGGALET